MSNNLIFRGRFWFSKKVLYTQFVDRFPIFLGLFPVFKKSFKFSVCWLVSSFRVRFLYFWVNFQFSKTISNSQFVDQFPLFFDPFPHFWVLFPFSEKVVNSQFVDSFSLFLTRFLIFKVSSLISFKFSSQFPHFTIIQKELYYLYIHKWFDWHSYL